MSGTITVPVSIPPDVERYCQSRGLLPDLYSALRIAEESYAPTRQWKIAIEPDPEVADEEYVVIDVTTTGDLEEILLKHKTYIHRWSRAASPEASWRIRVLWTVD